MSSYLLVLIIYAQSSATFYGGVDTDVTLHDFPSKELCESAAKHVTERTEPTFKTQVTWQCLKREAGEWK